MMKLMALANGQRFFENSRIWPFSVWSSQREIHTETKFDALSVNRLDQSDKSAEYHP